MSDRRLDRDVHALRDGALSGAQLERVEARLRTDPEAQRALRRSQAFGALVREAWSEGPPAPRPADLMRAIRPDLTRIDHERQHQPWPATRIRGLVLDFLRPLRAPALAGAAAAAAFWLFASGPVVEEAAPPAQVVVQSPLADETIYDLAQDDGSVVIYEGGEGATVILVGGGGDQISERATPFGGWA